MIHHSDAGSQHTSIRFTDRIVIEGLTVSIGSVGDAYDNVLAESLVGLYKTECVRPGPFHDGPFKTVDDANTRPSAGSTGLTSGDSAEA